MNIESLVSSDMNELAARTARAKVELAETRRALHAALDRRERRPARRGRMLAGALVASAAAFAVPVPHRSPTGELVWQSVYALARARLFHVDVALKGKTDAEAEAEIRKQLAEQGWPASDVRVERGNGSTTVELGALDEEGRHLRMLRHHRGETPERLQLRPEPIDDTREPGMTDAQLREKILAQIRARGLEGEVSVEGDRVRIQLRKQQPD